MRINPGAGVQSSTSAGVAEGVTQIRLVRIARQRKRRVGHLGQIVFVGRRGECRKANRHAVVNFVQRQNLSAE